MLTPHEKIFGNPGVEQAFYTNGRKAVLRLAFVTNKHRLVVLYSGGTIEVIDLEKRKSVGCTDLGVKVTAFQKGDPLSPYVFLGTENGNVFVIHVLQDAIRPVALSNYNLTYKMCTEGVKNLGLLLFSCRLSLCCVPL